MKLRIAFLGDVGHPNARSWIDALRETGGCDVMTWSLPATTDRRGRLNRLMAAGRAVIGLRRTLKTMAPDILIAYRTTSYGFLAASTNFHPLVVASQGETDVWPVDTWSTPFKRRMASIALRRADLVHAWGPHMAETSIALGAAKEKVLVRPRGVDLTQFTFPPARGVGSTLRLIATRSLFPEYRHALVLDAVADVSRRGVPIRFDIVGDGALMPALRAQSERLGLAGQVTFHGRVDVASLPSLLRESSVYVSMPVTEGVSASLFEAMACGCYPIVSDLPANRFWIRDEDNGALVRVDDRQALADALWRVWQNRASLDAVQLKNRDLVEREASLQNNVRHFVSRYEGLLRVHKNGSLMASPREPEIGG